ncbi:hypothetical protein BDFB_013943 [Asbolus verrucosus]|uniref:Uncharacterized protein n=1 Tax=Asbolus verrucosus TaxID=1661398 RepID=A0A482VWC8_ASBVE|nr:hypothetical protein BDFB_013943 [Asbolus verrucosus]
MVRDDSVSNGFMNSTASLISYHLVCWDCAYVVCSSYTEHPIFCNEVISDFTLI